MLSSIETSLYCHGCGKLLSHAPFGGPRVDYKPEDDCGMCRTHRLIDSGFTYAEMQVLKDSPEFMKAREKKK